MYEGRWCFQLSEWGIKSEHFPGLEWDIWLECHPILGPDVAYPFARAGTCEVQTAETRHKNSSISEPRPSLHIRCSQTVRHSRLKADRQNLCTFVVSWGNPWCTRSRFDFAEVVQRRKWNPCHVVAKHGLDSMTPCTDSIGPFPRIWRWVLNLEFLHELGILHWGFWLEPVPPCIVIISMRCHVSYPHLSKCPHWIRLRLRTKAKKGWRLHGFNV